MSATDRPRGADTAKTNTASAALNPSIPSLSEELEGSSAGEALPAAHVESADENAGFGSDAFDEDTDDDSAGATITEVDGQEADLETADPQSPANIAEPASELGSAGQDLDAVLNNDDEFDSDSSLSGDEELSVGEDDDGIFDSTDDEDDGPDVLTGQEDPSKLASARSRDNKGEDVDEDVLDSTGSSGSSSDSDSGLDDDEQLDILLEHIENQEIVEVKTLLDIEGDDDLLLNMPDDNNETPLMHAVATGNLRLVKLLLDYKADVDHTLEDGTNVLCTAIKYKNAQIGSLVLRSMLHGGGGPAAQAARAAAQRVSWEARNPVFDAIQENAPDFIHLLAASKAAIHGPGARKGGYGLLGLATKLNHVDCVEKLLSLSADPDERIHDDNSVLHVACRQGFFDAADVILSYNADVNLRTKQGWTPAHFAALAGDLDIIDMLIEEHADLSLRNQNGNTVRDIWNNMFPDTIGEYDECIENAATTASSKPADGSESTDSGALSSGTKPASKAALSTSRRRGSSGGGNATKGDIKSKPSREKSQPHPHSISPRRAASVQLQQFSEADVVTRLRTFPASQVSIKVPSATAPRDQLMGQPMFHLIVSCGIQCTWTKSLPFKDFRKLFMDLTQAHGRTMVAAAGIEPPRLVIGLGQTIIERQREVLAAFSKSLLQFRSPRPDEIIQFLVPEDAMLDKMNNFLKMNAQVNTLKQNASILAGLTESSITNNSDEEDALPERNGAGIDPATPPRRNGSTNIQGGGDSAGNTPAVRRRHPGVVAAAKAEFHPAASPSGVLADSPLPGQELPPSIDVAIPISIREQVSVLTNAYGQGMWVWGFGRSTYGGIRLLPRRAEYPETFLGGMIGAATAIAVVRAVAGIGWRGEVNVLGLRSKSTFFPVEDVATLAHLLVQFQEARKVAEQDQSPTRSSHVSVVVRPLLSQKNPFEGVLFDRKMTIHGYGSANRPKSPKATQSTTPKRNAGGFASMWSAKKVNADSADEEKRRRGLESTERAREYQNLFDNLALEARQAILGLNFGKQASVGQKMKTYLKRFLACMREFALARHGGRYTDVEFKKKVDHFKHLAKAIDEELDDMQGYLDKALSQLKGTFSGGNFIDMTIATWNSVSELRDMLSAGLLNLQQHSVS